MTLNSKSLIVDGFRLTQKMDSERNSHSLKHNIIVDQCSPLTTLPLGIVIIVITQFYVLSKDTDPRQFLLLPKISQMLTT